MEKSDSSITCKNCKWPGHAKPDCWSKGSGKEGQGPRQGKPKKGEKGKESAVVEKAKENELFAFTCTSYYATEAVALNISKDKHRVCLDSGASNHYCPNHDKFENYQALMGQDTTTADGQKLKAVGIGDVCIELPNQSKSTTSVLKKTIHVPEMAFTLISISQLDKADCQVTFRKSACTIHNPTSQIMVVIPHEDSLYQFPHGAISAMQLFIMQSQKVQSLESILIWT